MLDFIRARFSGSVTWLVGAIAVMAALIFLPMGWGEPLGAGILWKGFTALAGIVTWMFGLRLWIWIRTLSIFKSPALDRVKAEPLPYAIYLLGGMISAAIITASAIGQPPSPAAWPDPAAPVAVESATPEVWPARFADCEPYREDIEDAVQTYWGAWQYPDAWAAQLYQESLCNPSAISPAGAAGLAQFMPATWREAQAHFGIRASPHDDIAIEAGAWYMMRQMAVWRSPRPQIRRWELALASYNAGAGNIIRAQGECDGARDWDDILPCLPDVTGHHARETTQYVVRIRHHWQAMAGGNPLALPPELRS